MVRSGNSADLYYAAAQRLPADFLRSTFTENGLTQDEIRAMRIEAQNAKIDELLGHNSGAIDGRIDRGAATANRRRDERAKRAKAKAQADDVTLMAILDDIARIESDLAAQYGESFAGDLLADLNANGLIEDAEYTRIMAISDDTERRRTIALRIQEGLDNGTIKPSDLKGHPWAQAWLEKHEAATQAMVTQAARYERSEVSVDAIDRDAKDEAKYSAVVQSPDQQSEAEASTARQAQSVSVRNDTVEISSDFDASNLKF